jgi:fatty acid-binding protein DegV
MSLGILTNDSALFSFATPESMQSLRCMPLNANLQKVAAPTQADFERAYNQMEHEFSTLLVLCPAPALLDGLEAAQAAARGHGGQLKISILDTGQIGPGLGMLAQLAARQAADGASLAQVEDGVRAAIPYLFTLLCPGKNPHDLPSPGTEPASQPIFSLEDGGLLPYKKTRVRRHLLEDLQEFMEEFDSPQQLTFFHGNTNKLRSHVLHDVAGRLFTGLPLNELSLNLPLTALFGPQTAGLTVLEMPSKLIQ